MDIINYVTSYTIAFVIAEIIINYVLGIQYLIIDNTELVNEYYIDNIWKGLMYDYFLILFYLCVAYVIIYFMDTKNYATQISIISSTTFIISGLAVAYISSKPESNNIFSRIIHNAGYNLIINDIIIVISTFLFYTAVIR